MPLPSFISSISPLHSPPSFSLLSAKLTRPRMSSSATSSVAIPLPENRVVLGVGGTSVDFLAAVATYPNPDDKIRTTSLKVQGGGNVGNALTSAARLGLTPRIISKVANDSQGRSIVEELEADGIDTSFLVVSEGGNSPFTYIIVDNKTHTRTCIHTPGSPPMVPEDLSRSNLLSALDGARIVYFDVRLHETALVVAQEAARQNIPILIDAEKKREGLDDLLAFANYVVCSAKFPQEWTEAPSIPSALVSILLQLPNVRFVIVTLGENGCIMLERSTDETPDQLEEFEVDSLLEMVKARKDENLNVPTYVSSGGCFVHRHPVEESFEALSTMQECTGITVLGVVCRWINGCEPVAKLRADGIGTVCGRLLLGTAEKIPESEIVDTTGAGDAFIGAVIYAICANMPLEKLLPFSAQVAAGCCRALGARSGLPHRTDPRLASFFH